MTDGRIRSSTHYIARLLAALRQQLTRAQRDDLAAEVAHCEAHLAQLASRLTAGKKGLDGRSAEA